MAFEAATLQNMAEKQQIVGMQMCVRENGRKKTAVEPLFFR
ncbi:hypothetical protein [Pseudoduganella chitinolytica]|uniref:Uncharacterized protein n=1 Tax=Pseudoduganella chitinolytica TaxID=34070 RepID=A0ABY8B734_9BURK|nr:hypothetical protein [Pseudoduganella chitinolytica]WEF30816.1 hypothetical protein PX653_15180 [Pseudoduganella chitinolytica]